MDLISDLKFQQTITDGDTAEAYGFHQPTATLNATRGDGTELSLVLGKPTMDKKSYYLMMDNDESTTYIIADTLDHDLRQSHHGAAAQRGPVEERGDRRHGAAPDGQSPGYLVPAPDRELHRL